MATTITAATKKHQNLQNTAERLKILTRTGTAAVGLEQAERIDEHRARAHDHHCDVDSREPGKQLPDQGKLIEHHGQEFPNDDGRDDVAGRDYHLTVEEHVVPLGFGLPGQLSDEGNQHLPSQEIARPSQDYGHDNQKYVADHGNG